VKVQGTDGKKYAPSAKAANDPERIEQMREMAATGATGDQIAKTLGRHPQYVRALARRHGVDIQADRVVGKRRKIDSNRVVTETVIGASGLAVGLDLIDFETLDVDQLDEWTSSLRDSLRSLYQLHR